MGWSIGYDSKWDRDIGYGVPAICDHPDCNEEIHRGLAYVCANQEPYGGSGCGLYFCSVHLSHHRKGVGRCCQRCAEDQKPFDPKPDVKDWVKWKLTDNSWWKWRKENPQKVSEMKAMLEGK
jgi:hypothetical protein